MQLSKPQINFGDTLVIASHNNGKIKEFETLLRPFDLKVITSSDLNIKDVKETGKSFKENSILKVKSIPDKYIAISDDSGLCVSCLDNQPGIYSARFAKENGGWKNAMKLIYEKILLAGEENFEASFFCSLSIKFPGDIIFSYDGEVKGEIIWPPKGENGFGYDPFFVPQTGKKTFGEIEHLTKIKIDHRSVAIKKLIKSHLTDS